MAGWAELARVAGWDGLGWPGWLAGLARVPLIYKFYEVFLRLRFILIVKTQ